MEKEHDFFCTSKSHKMERFLEVCLLLLLYDEVGYGYGLIEQLAYFGFSQEELNVGTLYRTLRKMEKEGLVSSLWEEGGQGPRRRVYEITESGKRNLDQWINILEIRKARIDKLILKYEEKTITERRMESENI
ncbi:MAG: PadR family transcriptional regulator [Firmicutes bacterium HGW-Firmicutes-3]|jgi:poly-beta-hydroxybutyrate-responsive repressor|nr:MAG: PadR family transcriptional regulator [Firmicutes bacterium HGW-Firmicutes-3]